jgi:hypothetical protein
MLTCVAYYDRADDLYYDSILEYGDYDAPRYHWNLQMLIGVLRERISDGYRLVFQYWQR